MREGCGAPESPRHRPCLRARLVETLKTPHAARAVLPPTSAFRHIATEMAPTKRKRKGISLSDDERAYYVAASVTGSYSSQYTAMAAAAGSSARRDSGARDAVDADDDSVSAPAKKKRRVQSTRAPAPSKKSAASTPKKRPHPRARRPRPHRPRRDWRECAKDARAISGNACHAACRRRAMPFQRCKSLC